MSFRDTPITKNCDVMNVMGRKIVTSRGRKNQVGREEIINNWQPLQIYANKVKPCNIVYTGYLGSYVDAVYYMPKINGIPIDDPRASINWSGDVYLSVKFTVDDDTPFLFKIDPDPFYPPQIGPESKGVFVEYESEFGGPGFSITQPWCSWKIGTVNDSYLRYFSAKNELSQEEIDAGPIYKKDVIDPAFPNELFWGTVAVFVLAPVTDAIDGGSDQSLGCLASGINAAQVYGNNAGAFSDLFIAPAIERFYV
jgi:hypothetical protein